MDFSANRSMEEEDFKSTGTVCWFNDRKGYGFIKSDDGGEEIFVHHSGIKSDGFRTLKEGQVVEFVIVLENGLVKAVDVTGPYGTSLDQIRKESYGLYGGGRGGRYAFGGGEYRGSARNGGGGNVYCDGAGGDEKTKLRGTVRSLDDQKGYAVIQLNQSAIRTLKEGQEVVVDVEFPENDRTKAVNSSSVDQIKKQSSGVHGGGRRSHRGGGTTKAVDVNGPNGSSLDIDRIKKESSLPYDGGRGGGGGGGFGGRRGPRVRRGRGGGGRYNLSQVVCYNCGCLGHLARDC